jgi:hypothetical protein
MKEITPQERWIEVLEREKDIILREANNMILSASELQQDRFRAFDYALSLIEAWEKAEKELPKKKQLPLNAYSCDERGFNQAHDIFTPVVAKLIRERVEMTKIALKLEAERDKLLEELKAIRGRYCIQHGGTAPNGDGCIKCLKAELKRIKEGLSVEEIELMLSKHIFNSAIANINELLTIGKIDDMEHGVQTEQIKIKKHLVAQAIHKRLEG